jgi:hypothetical protein
MGVRILRPGGELGNLMEGRGRRVPQRLKAAVQGRLNATAKAAAHKNAIWGSWEGPTKVGPS